MNNSTQLYSKTKAASYCLALAVMFNASLVVGEEKPATQSVPTLATGASPIPSATALADLTRSTMLLVNEGSKDGNFTGLYAQFSPAVQKNVDQNKLNEALANFRERKIALSALTHTEPVFFEAPQMDQQGILKLVGMFPTQPRMVRFNLGYRQIDGKWLLELFTVDTPTLKELDAAAKVKPQTTTSANHSTNQAVQKPSAKKDSTLAEHQTPKASSQNTSASAALDLSTDPPTTTKW